MGPMTEIDVDVPLDPLAAAIAKQEELLTSMQQAYGEFHTSVSDDLAQLATLYNMRGDHERALTLLHTRLVIHEKHGPPERIGETLHQLGTTYRLHNVPDLAQQHLERALATHTASHGDKSVKVAETLNSLALLHQARSDNDKAEVFQLQSLQVLLESDEPVDMESEDVPWEVYKRLKQQRGPSTAANSLTLLKGTMRQCVAEALSRAKTAVVPDSPLKRENVAFFGADGNGETSPQCPPEPSHALSVGGRSKSDSAMLTMQVERDAVEELERHSEDLDEARQRQPSLPPSLPLLLSPSNLPPRLLSPSRSAAVVLAQRNQQPIENTASLLARVERVKRCIVAGAQEMDMELARFAADVDGLPMVCDLRSMGEAMVGLVREMHRMRVRTGGDGDAGSLPVLEG